MTNTIQSPIVISLLAAMVVSGVELEETLNHALSILCLLRSYLSEPRKIMPMYDLIGKTLDKLLPWNAHDICSDKLGVSVTKLWPFKNTLVSKFRSRSDLIDAACAGCFIPMWSGSLVGPRFRGKIHLDGAYTNNKPKFDPEPGVVQVTVCPFAGDIDVSPKDKHNWGEMCVFGTRYIFNWNNFVRSTQAMIPMRRSTYKQYLIQGHSDMKQYILDNDFIKCQSCYPVKEHSTSCRNTAIGMACMTCLLLLERVDSLKLPENLIRLFDEED